MTNSSLVRSGRFPERAACGKFACPRSDPLVLVLTAAILLLTACSESESSHSGGEIGMVLPDAPLRGLGGDFHRLSEMRGRPLVVNVWASWCGPCREEMTSLERLSKLAPAKLKVIGISTDDDANLAREFVARAGISFSSFHDADQNLERKVFGAAAIPVTLVVDAQGKIVQRVVGAREWDSQQSIALIESALGMPLR